MTKYSGSRDSEPVLVLMSLFIIGSIVSQAACHHARHDIAWDHKVAVRKDLSHFVYKDPTGAPLVFKASWGGK